MRILLGLTFALALVLPSRQGDQSAGSLPFDSGWTLQGDRTKIVRDGGRDALQLESGAAHRTDVRFEDGTIDFDVKLTRRRSFVYLYFRVQAEGEREEFYLRPHKSGLPDSVQYAPVWQGASAWQLHHGPGGTAAIEFAVDRWTHVRVIAQGRYAALFVDDMKTPAVLVPQLAREPRPGSISVAGFLPPGTPGEGPIATIANVQVKAGVAPFDFQAAIRESSSKEKAEASPAVVVREWTVSQSFVPKEDGEAALPSASVTGTFQRIAAEPSGLVQLHRDVKMPPGSRLTAAVARVTVSAQRAGVFAFDLGFSDVATVFVNGTPLFRGDASYSFDRPRREGLIGFDQARLFLPLRAGENELAIVVSDSFGGWGLMGRFPEAQGVTLSIPNR